MAYTRRSELTCTEAELITYGDKILMVNELLAVILPDGRRGIKYGDGVTPIKSLPYSINYAEIDARATAASQSAASAKTDADRANVEADRAAGIDAYTKADGANAILQSLSGMMLNCQNVASGSKLNTLLVQGNTTEVGTGDKSPSNPYVLHGVGESGNIGLRLTGKNLVTESLLISQGWVKQSDGSLYCENNATVNSKRFFENKAKAPGSFTFSVAIKYLLGDQTTPANRGLYLGVWYTDDTNKAVYPAASSDFSSLVFTTDPQKTVAFIYFTYTSATNSTWIKNPQLEFKGSATNFETGAENNLSIPTSAPLYSMPDGTRDELNPFTGVITRNVGKVIVGGAESGLTFVSMYTSVDCACFCYRQGSVGKLRNAISGKLQYSDNIVVSASTAEEAFSVGGSPVGGAYYTFYLKVKKSRIVGWSDALTDAEKVSLFNAWLQNNSIEIHYQLAAPTTEQNTPIQRPAMYAPITNIFGTDNYAAYLTAKHVADTLSKIDEKANKAQEAWITPTLVNGATGTIKYRKNNFRRVEFKGTLTIGSNDNNQFILPSGYRPLETIQSIAVPVTDRTGFVYLALTTTGVIYNYSSTGKTVSFDGFSFVAEQ